jgi:hypothetical protein
MRQIFIWLLLPLLSCGLTKRAKNTNPSITNITLSNFPSWDTASISYLLEKEGWYIKYRSRNLAIDEKPAVRCRMCDSMFSAAFFADIMTLQSEELSNDCIIYSDTIVDGVKIVGINNFYNHSDLREETISYKYLQDEKTVSYMEPRHALKYCKNNTARLRFIKVSDALRVIR